VAGTTETFAVGLQLLQALKNSDLELRASFCANLLRLKEEDGFPEKLVFSDEETFHISEKVNRHNVKIWGTEIPHAIFEHQRDSPKPNVFCAISHQKIYGLFFFAKATVTGATYLDMLEQWLLPHLEKDSVDFIFQHDAAPPSPRITISTFGATSMADCHNDGLAVQPRGMKNCFVVHHVPQISPRLISSSGVTSRIVCLYHHLQTRWLKCARTS
jgi:hypothetical protein